MASTPTDSGAGQTLQTLTLGPRETVKHILNLPLEIVLKLKTYIQDEDLLLLASTCRSLRNICHLDPGNHSRVLARLSPSRRAQFMITLSRGSYTHWPCWHCQQLHRIFEMDLPGCPPHVTWRRLDCVSVRGIHRSADRLLTPVDLSGLAFHHVQIALRFARLGMQHVPDNQARRRVVPAYLRVQGQRHTVAAEEFYNRIIQPRGSTYTHQTLNHTHGFVIAQQFRRKIIQDPTANCPIANLPQLRFLQKTAVDITRLEGQGFPWPDAIYKICPHINISSRYTYGIPGYIPTGQTSTSTHPAESLSHMFGFGIDFVAHTLLFDNISSNWRLIQRETQGSCVYCLTDYEITFSMDQPHKLILKIWQDFGTECHFDDAGEWNDQRLYHNPRSSFPSLYFPKRLCSSSGRIFHHMQHRPGAVANFYHTGRETPRTALAPPPSPSQPQQQAIALMHRPSTLSSASQAAFRQRIENVLRQHNLETGAQLMTVSNIPSYTLSLFFCLSPFKVWQTSRWVYQAAYNWWTANPWAGIVRMITNRARGD